MNITGNRLFVLDTNVLMHDPTSIFRFKEHDIYIPMVVLEELDKGKKGMSEVSQNVRQVSRFLDQIITDANLDDISGGIQLPGSLTGEQENQAGRLFFQTQEESKQLPPSLPGNTPDNNILGIALALQHSWPEVLVTLVSKDINLRIKAAVVGVHTEDYSNDRVLEDADLLYQGYTVLDANFWDQHSQQLNSWQEQNHSYYKLKGDDIKDWYVNQFLCIDQDKNFEAIVRKTDNDAATIEILKSYYHPPHSVWGINARNREQNYALNALMDPSIDFVSLLGAAGTGKTLLTLAAGLAQVLDSNTYREIIMTRVTVPVGEDIGFLPGTEEEKMTPWMGALMDNLEVLTEPEADNSDWGQAATNDLLKHRIKIHSLNFMRGRTFLGKFIIIDEAQNLTSKQMKTLITRAGPGSKIVCLGNIAQIDTPYLTETTSGLTYVVDKFKHWEHSAHITLAQGERSRLADFASKSL